MITRYSDFVHSGNRKESALNFHKGEETVNEGIVEDLIRKVQLDSFDDEEEEEFEIPNFHKASDTEKQIQMEDFIDPAFIKPKIVEPVVKREEYREEPKFEEPKIPIDPLAYQIFRDKSETFECKVMIEGSNVSNTAVRLLLESQEWNIFFKGSIENGICRIPLKKISILSPGLKGVIKLEVVVDGEIFYPWYETFQMQNSRNVKVEILSQKQNNQAQSGTRVRIA